MLPLLLADWLQAIGPLIGVIFWVVYQVLVAMGEERESGKRAKQRPEPDPDMILIDESGRPIDPETGQPIMAIDEALVGDQQEVRSEVDEFLKRVGAEPVGQVQAEPERQRPQLDPFEEPPRRQKRKRRRKPNTDRPEVEVLIGDQARAASEKQVDYGRLAEERLSEQASHLGEKIAQADDRVEARLHEKFDHRLGKLSRRESGSEPTTKEPESTELSPAERARALLSSPQGVRDAVILNEIFSRPSDRWS